jgi:hypothetical protein
LPRCTFSNTPLASRLGAAIRHRTLDKLVEVVTSRKFTARKILILLCGWVEAQNGSVIKNRRERATADRLWF